MDRILEILRLVEEGQLDSLQAYAEIREVEARSKAGPNNFLKIRIFGDDLTKIDLPLSLAGLGLKFAHSFIPDFKDLNLSQGDLDQALKSIEKGETGEVAWLEAGTGEKIHIFIE